MVRGIGLAMLVVGIGLGYWGYEMSGSFEAHLTKTVSGSMPDEVMYRYIGGAVSGVVGVFLALKG
jgi:hypothetical protein